MKSLHKILVPTDFSELSFTALEYVLSTAVMCDAEIFLMYVVEDMTVHGLSQPALHSETVLRDYAAKAKEELSHHTVRKTNGKNVVSVVQRGEAYKEIVRFAREEGIDLIVMATHGRTGFAHVLMGSVAEKVVRHSPIPVLTVKPESVWNNVLDEQDVEEQLHLKQ